MVALDGSDVASLRRLNGRAILGRLFDTGTAATISELMSSTGLSRPTVEAALQGLVTEGWIVPRSGARPATAGRPARSFAFSREAGSVVGIDLGPHGVSVDVSDLRGESRALVRSTETDLGSADAALATTTATFQEAVDRAGADPATVLAITVGLPAVVGADGGIALSRVVPEWRSGALVQRLRDALPGRILFTENDAKLAGLAELTWGASRGSDIAVHVYIGRRISSSVVVHGRPVRGFHGAAGELGALASLGWGAAPDAILRAGSGAASEFAAADSGDRRAQSNVAAFLRELASGVAAVCLVVDPEVVVLGGGIARVGRPLLDGLAQELAGLVLFPPRLALSEFDNAVTRGAVARGVEHFRGDVLRLDSSTG